MVPGWELYARRLLDTENVELFLSGSSAWLLSREVATSMRGRAMEAVVTPFSLRKVLRHARREPAPTADRLTKAERSRLIALFDRCGKANLGHTLETAVLHTLQRRGA